MKKERTYDLTCDMRKPIQIHTKIHTKPAWLRLMKKQFLQKTVNLKKEILTENQHRTVDSEKLAYG